MTARWVNWRPARSLGVLILTASMIACAGCAAVKVAYEEGDTFVLFWGERYISLDSQQTELARPRIQAWFHWHRTEALPDYARLATALQQRIQKNQTPADMEMLDREFRLRYEQMVERALPGLADIALSIRPDQLDQLQKKFDSNDATYRSDFVDISAERRRKDLYTKTADRVEDWYGSLSAEQKAALRKMTDALPIDPVLWLAERHAREQEFVELMHAIADQKPARTSVIESFRKYALRLQTSPDPARHAYIDTLNRANREMYMNIANMTTTEQRAHATAKLGDWIVDFNELAKGD